MLKTVEFHRSWMIEVVAVEDGFKFVCYSPLGELFGDDALYAWQWRALQSGIRLVDQFYACYALREVVRSAYEAEVVIFEELQALNQSLDYLSRGQFTRSPS